MADRKKPTAKSAVAESAYPVTEIVAAAEKIFGGQYTKALVLAALRFGGCTDNESVTVSRAKELVAAFAKRKVAR